jgi:hypothetical protein
LALAVSVPSLLFAPDAGAARRPFGTRNPGGTLGLLGPARELTETTWLVAGLHDDRRYALAAGPSLGLLERYLEPGRNHSPEWRTFLRGRYGAPSWEPWAKLKWRSGGSSGSMDELPAPAAEISWLREPRLSLRASWPAAPFDAMDPGSLALRALAAPEPEPLAIAARNPCPRWKAPPQVTIVRYDGAEWDRFALLDCEGAIAPDAADRLAVLARPPGTPRPELPLPLTPEGGAEPGEWLPSVRLLHPRLVWVVEKIAEAFPARRIYLMSGYRRDGHSGLHQKGRALDLSVAGVPNEQLFALCKSLPDVGCGFYPNNRFIHVDDRAHGLPRVVWVDVSEPGRPSEYVDGWQSLIAPGIAWLPTDRPARD